MPQHNETVQAKIPDNGWRYLQIKSRGRKATIKYSNYVKVYNAKQKQGKCIDWSNVEEWKEVAPEKILLLSIDNPSVLEAKLEKWKQYNVYDEVENNGQKFISVH